MARVLIVDDNADVRLALEDILVDAGHEVLTAADGSEAVNKALADRPELILLDLLMPRFDGMEVMRRLREPIKAGLLPVIIITGAGGRDQMMQALAYGACGFIDKPWHPGEVEGQVDWALRAAARRRAGKPLPDSWAPIRGRLLIG
jgi:DNA-binding response OmpR family regulator